MRCDSTTLTVNFARAQAAAGAWPALTSLLNECNWARQQAKQHEKLPPAPEVLCRGLALHVARQRLRSPRIALPPCNLGVTCVLRIQENSSSPRVWPCSTTQIRTATRCAL